MIRTKHDLMRMIDDAELNFEMIEKNWVYSDALTELEDEDCLSIAWDVFREKYNIATCFYVRISANEEWAEEKRDQLNELISSQKGIYFACGESLSFIPNVDKNNVDEIVNYFHKLIRKNDVDRLHLLDAAHDH